MNSRLAKQSSAYADTVVRGSRFEGTE